MQWPIGWPRTPDNKRERAKFSQRISKDSYKEPITFEVATTHLFDELKRLGDKNPILSSNLQIRQDGIPYANQRKPDDPGIAVYFTLNGREQCIPCDKWDRAEDNIRAIAKTIEALRGIKRWGTKQIVNATFKGFTALPSPDQVIITAVQYFDGCHTQTEIKSKYRELAKKMHPDFGGDPAEFHELQRQYDQLTRGEK